jgi:hypothetical protein
MSAKAKDILKNGWHPEKNGSSVRGSVSGMLGRGKKTDDSSSNHVAQPISSLRDPASFAPPPKRTGSGLVPPPPPSTGGTRKVVPAPSKYQDPRAPAVTPPPRQTQAFAAPQQEQGVEQANDPDSPRRPYRVDTSGLSTDHLPKPPGRKDGADGREPPPPSYETAVGGAGRPPPPRLPPRLPPRTNSGSTAPVLAPLSTGGDSPQLNQGAVSRLGAAGISVPGLGIGRTSPATPSSPSVPPASGNAPSASPVNQLQNRFSQMRTTTPTSTEAPAPAQGTSWAQKQASLKTVSNFNKDPSSVSLADARSAASTANNFRQRHGEQVASGVQTAQKYGVFDKATSLASQSQGQGQSQDQDQGQVQSGLSGMSAAAGMFGKKKPPPPPPKRKPGLSPTTPTTPEGGAADADVPPPIPMGTRPKF